MKFLLAATLALFFSTVNNALAKDLAVATGEDNSTLTLTDEACTDSSAGLALAYAGQDPQKALVFVVRGKHEGKDVELPGCYVSAEAPDGQPGYIYAFPNGYVGGVYAKAFKPVASPAGSNSGTGV